MAAGSPSRPWLLQYTVEPIGPNFMVFTLKVMIIQPGPLCGVLRKVARVHITCRSPLNTHCHCHSRLCLGSAWIVNSDRLECVGNQVVIQTRPCCPPAKHLSLSRVLKNLGLTCALSEPSVPLTQLIPTKLTLCLFPVTGSNRNGALPLCPPPSAQPVPP